MIEQLVDKQGKRLYDVIGIQSHMHGGVWPVAEGLGDLRAVHAVRRAAALHRDDDPLGRARLGEERRLALDARGRSAPGPRGRPVLHDALLAPGVEAITWWDFSDFQSWQNAPSGLLRKDMTPKPAYDELKRLIKGKWWTTADVTTDEKGESKVTGFLGDYTVTVAASGQRQPVKQMLKKGENRWVLELK